MPFEIPASLAGLFDVTMSDLTAASIVEPGARPSTIIRTDHEWYVNLEWDTSGPLTGWIGGTWHLHLYLESMGPGDEVELFDEKEPPADPGYPKEHDIPLTPGPSPRHYHLHPDIKKNAVKPGAYKLVATVTYTDLAGNPGEMAGYWEGPIVQFITPAS